MQQARAEITSSEFVDWIAFFDLELNEFNRQDYFLANIAKEVCRTRAKHPEKVTIKSFLLKFGEKKVVKIKPETREQSAAKAKSFFGLPLNLIRKKR